MKKHNVQENILLTGAMAFVVVPAIAKLHTAKNNHPNIIYIMCDDMGYGDLECY